ncbi:MAG: T9SS type A sorting domain-containing protein [Cytophagales bacterium]
MKRGEFLKNGLGFLGMALVAPSLIKASTNASTCSTTSAETEGPFPTKSPSSLIKSNIIGDRTGVPFTMNITILNTNNNCAPLQGAFVDIWHCDKDGYYSEYGGTSMQTVDYTSNHFLRGRQITDTNGLVTFTSIFPGWYTSRATHIHVHVYNASGTSLLVTQIAFPEGSNSAVVQVNSATAYGYTKGMTGYTYNASDNVFSDSVANEMSTVTGSISDGFVLTHSINVSGPVNTTDLNEEDASNAFLIGANYPNPFSDQSNLPLKLNYPSSVTLEIYNTLGRLISKEGFGTLATGEHLLNLNSTKLNLVSGNYICNISIENSNGVYKQARVITKL